MCALIPSCKSNKCLISDKVVSLTYEALLLLVLFVKINVWDKTLT